MADNYQYITTTGLIVPDTQTLRDQVVSEYTSAFGQDLDTSPPTPQGILITSDAVARSQLVSNNAALANQINPRVSEGVFLDALCALTGNARIANSYSTVFCDLTGQPGAVIPATCAAQLPSGELFSPITQIILDANGLGSVIFKAVNPGPIQVAPGALNTIAPGRGVLGWLTITNQAEGEPGGLEQSDVSLRANRDRALAAQGVALNESAKAALVEAKIGVTSVSSFENYENVGKFTDDGAVFVEAHHMYYCVDGATDEDIAKILRAKKSCGSGWTGTVVVNVTVPVSGQVYEVRFDRPTYVPILAEFVVKLTAAFQGDVVKAVKDAVITYVNGGLSDEPGLQIQSPVSSFELAGAVNIKYPGIFVHGCKIRKTTTPVFSCDTIPILINERATIEPDSIQVTIL